MTNDPSSHDNEKVPKFQEPRDFSRFKVNDSFRLSHTDSSFGDGEDSGRHHISRQQLEELDLLLSDRDKEVLMAIRKHRYLLSSQVQRLLFYDASTMTAALRAANRCLKRLREKGLIGTLSRRIGGVRAGSGSMVNYLTHAGERLLRLREENPTLIKRFFEPSPYFLAHSLAVADIAIQLSEICRVSETELIAVQSEPECWRNYSDLGKLLSLKPDLFAITASDEYEDRWFWEIDLSTESPIKIVEKCQKYHQYYRSGLEQEENDVFPLTVWIVPDLARKERLLSHIRGAFEKQPKSFSVIVKDELEDLILHGGDRGSLC